jgi:hypothetical protein
MERYVLEISWYKKVGDDFVGSEPIVEEALPEIKKILNLDPSESIVDAYSVSSTIATFLKQHLKHQIDTNKFDYFIEGYVKHS